MYMLESLWLVLHVLKVLGHELQLEGLNLTFPS